ncbi:hypothetical protein M0811_10587 [Anaeramoeba ignava]|uniref:DUF402 domain-containing protein n=1 Tax=Anaeramoeba ignava TaxID=1746090 RepID=A0A9Q0LE88_ANAIG|nr:hypothetical protein M0811_10587 [Anaeramoeba ignava]
MQFFSFENLIQTINDPTTVSLFPKGRYSTALIQILNQDYQQMFLSSEQRNRFPTIRKPMNQPNLTIQDISENSASLGFTAQGTQTHLQNLFVSLRKSIPSISGAIELNKGTILLGKVESVQIVKKKKDEKAQVKTYTVNLGSFTFGNWATSREDVEIGKYYLFQIVSKRNKLSDQIECKMDQNTLFNYGYQTWSCYLVYCPEMDEKTPLQNRVNILVNQKQEVEKDWIDNFLLPLLQSQQIQIPPKTLLYVLNPEANSTEILQEIGISTELLRVFFLYLENANKSGITTCYFENDNQIQNDKNKLYGHVLLSQGFHSMNMYLSTECKRILDEQRRKVLPTSPNHHLIRPIEFSPQLDFLDFISTKDKLSEKEKEKMSDLLLDYYFENVVFGRDDWRWEVQENIQYYDGFEDYQTEKYRIEKGDFDIYSFCYGSWVSIHRYCDKSGNFKCGYCNISLPIFVGFSYISYCDLEIDMIVLNDGSKKVVDEFEYSVLKERGLISEFVDEKIKVIIEKLKEFEIKSSDTKEDEKILNEFKF